MSIINFTVEETNLIAIYKADTAALEQIAAALTFAPADETEG